MSTQKVKTRNGIRYRFDRTVKGHRLMSPVIYPTKQDAMNAERFVVNAFLQGQKIPLISADKSDTVLNLLNRRLTWIKEHRGSFYFQTTDSLFARALAFAPEWCDLHPSQITAKDVELWSEKWAADLASRGKSRYDVNKALVALQATWNAPWGRRRGPREYPNNPFAWIDRFPIEKKAKYIPSVSEAQKVLDAAFGLGKTYLRMMAETGARPSEARTLKWQDVGDGHVILYTRKKKGGDLTPRRIPISEGLARILRGFRFFNPSDIYVFQQDHKPEPRVHRWAQNIQIQACKNVGARFFPLHSWRHFHASKLADDGQLSLPQIQRRLGHESATTTDRYLHEIKGV
jgi:integrase